MIKNNSSKGIFCLREIILQFAFATSKNYVNRGFLNCFFSARKIQRITLQF